jgi:predicted nuclease of predicted toxin-antitoxin system
MTKPVYCDESIWIPVADGLRRRGWTVYTAREQGTLGDPDVEQLRYAVANDWLLLTFDDDFLSLVEGEGREHCGLIYVSQAGRKTGGVVKAVDEHLQTRAEDDQSIQYL